MSISKDLSIKAESDEISVQESRGSINLLSSLALYFVVPLDRSKDHRRRGVVLIDPEFGHMKG